MDNNKKKLNAKDLIVTGVFAGPIFMLFIAKVPKYGALAAVGGVLCALGTFTGMHWGMNFGFLICSIIASVIAGLGKFKNKFLNIVAYITYCIGPMGTYFVFYFNRESWISFMLKKGTEQEYIDKMIQTSSAQVMVIMVAGTIVVATLSGALGLHLMRKQFVKAGITA